MHKNMSASSRSGIRRIRQKTGKEEEGLRSTPLLNETIAGRYVLKREIGKGGTAFVYEAYDLEENKTVALKISRDKKYDRFIRNETSKLKNLSSRNTVRLFASGTFNERHYLVMEHLEGGNLSSIVENANVVDWKRSKQILIAICDAVAEVHEHGIVHRDLKPSNLMLSEDRDELIIKIIDFGLSRHASKCSASPDGPVEGSLPYMAPEIASGLAHDERADVYSVGVQLYTFLSGTLPLRYESDADGSDGRNSGSIEHFLRVLVSEKPRPPSVVASHLLVPSEAEEVVMRALEKEPEKRFQTILELRDAINQIDNGPTFYLSSIMPRVPFPKDAPTIVENAVA